MFPAAGPASGLQGPFLSETVSATRSALGRTKTAPPATQTTSSGRPGIARMTHQDSRKLSCRAWRCPLLTECHRVGRCPTPPALTTLRASRLLSRRLSRVATQPRCGVKTPPLALRHRACGGSLYRDKDRLPFIQGSVAKAGPNNQGAGAGGGGGGGGNPAIGGGGGANPASGGGGGGGATIMGGGGSPPPGAWSCGGRMPAAGGGGIDSGAIGRGGGGMPP